MNSFKTVCIDIGASPLLGGALLSIAEGVIEFGNISLCMFSGASSEKNIEKVDAILRMSLDIEGVLGASYSVNSDVKISHGRVIRHAHNNYGRVVDSPARLIRIAPANRIHHVLKFRPQIYLSAAKKLGIEEGSDNLVLHANLIKSSFGFSKKRKSLSLGIESYWARAIKRFMSSQKYVSIILIGTDSKHFRNFNLHDVYNASNKGLNLAEQLSLVAKSRGFIGMSAGPSVIALLDSVPFYIFKDCNHHKAQMDRELIRENRYTFSTANQFYIREYPSSNVLYDSMISIIRRGNNWHT
jgi:hypothetical protein